MSDSPHGVGHTDSMDSNDLGPKQPEKKKSRRPANTAFRQQRLKAWQPILTPKSVLPLFFAIGIIFAPIGGLLLYASAEVKELRLDYTHCQDKAPIYTDNDDHGFEAIPSEYVHPTFKNKDKAINAMWARQEKVKVTLDTGFESTANICRLQFTTPEDMGPPVLFYYHLTNFYQNHRRYVDSFDLDQLKGKARTYSQLKGSDCDPLYGNKSLELPYFPCGLVANSLFNDTFSSPTEQNPSGAGDSDPKVYEMNNSTNIAWGSDKDLYSATTDYTHENCRPPPNWVERYPDGVYSDKYPPPNLKDWEALQVWMRTAGLPTFSKLYQRNDDNSMEEGTYEIIVQDRFPTAGYKATKSVLITTRTVMGGKNPFLGIAYIVVGGVCILLGAVFTVTHLFKPRKLGDHTYLSWNNAPGGKSTATASGRDSRPADA